MGHTATKRALGNAQHDQMTPLPGQSGAGGPSRVDLDTLMKRSAVLDRRAANDGRRTGDSSSGGRVRALPALRTAGTTVFWFGFIALLTAMNLLALLAYTSVIEI